MPSIRSFVHPHVAFYRTNLRTYFICKWNEVARVWLPYTGEAETAAVLRRSTRHSGAANLSEVDLDIRKSNRPLRIRAVSDGYYLTLANGTIATILSCPVSVFPARYMKLRHSAIPAPLEDRTSDILLWHVHQPQTPPLPPPPQQQQVFTLPMEPIPRRIAWLIAEDAAKKEEVCAITFDTISPITCAVTTCFHCFDADSINAWLIHNASCPMCKRPCLATKAFEEGDPT